MLSLQQHGSKPASQGPMHSPCCTSALARAKMQNTAKRLRRMLERAILAAAVTRRSSRWAKGL